MSVDFDFCDWVKPDCMISLSENKSEGYLWQLCMPFFLKQKILQITHTEIEFKDNF